VSSVTLARGDRAQPWIYGHRGTRRGAPENTLEAMRMALQQGADGIELDVRLCKSGEVVVLHDVDLQRVAGVRVAAAEADLEEVQRHDLGGGARVPLLADAIELVIGSGKLLNIELKADVPDAFLLVERVSRQLEQCSADERARLVLSSFSMDICDALVDSVPDIAVGALFEHEPALLPAGVRAIHPRHVLVTKQLIARAGATGLLVNTWTVNDGSRAAELAGLGVDAIITDDVPVVQAGLFGVH
jgi:glycerophosphoryl diester phosphodiesterase